MGAGPGGAKGGRGDLGEASDLDGFFTFDEDSEGSVSKFCSKADMMQPTYRQSARRVAQGLRHGSLGSAMYLSLGIVYRERPIFAYIDETLTPSQDQIKCDTAGEVLDDTLALAESLDKRFHVRGEGGEPDALVVAYGTMKGPMFNRLYLLSLISGFITLPLLNYMDICDGVRAGLNEMNYKVKSIILFSNALSVKSQAKFLRECLPSSFNIHAVGYKPETFPGHLDALEASYGSLLSSGRKIRRKNLEISTDEMNELRGGITLVARSLADGTVGIVAFEWERILRESRREWAHIISSGSLGLHEPQLTVAPISSGDSVFLIPLILAGSVTVFNVLGFENADVACRLIQCSSIGATPMQFRQLHEVALEREKVRSLLTNLEKKQGTDFFGRDGVPCMSGGGAPNPWMEDWMISRGYCSSVSESYGFYETLSLMSGEQNYYNFDSSVVESWKLIETPGYSLKKGLKTL
ncbi:hypothetical protein AAMO2058_001295200 [Amorphochlora amoebiformis]